jgi:c-di-GMP-binding flagellar brake protein YcgR
VAAATTQGDEPVIDVAVDRPEERSEADVTLITRGITVAARVEVSQEHLLVVCPAGEGTTWKTSVRAGDPVEVYWVGGHEERTLKATISEVEEGVEPRWYLAVAGPAQRSQRRKAVRARVELPVMMPWAGATLVGKTVDVSEAGMRALVDGWGLPPEPGTGLDVSLTLEDAVLDLKGEVVWHADRGPQWLMAMSFVDVPEQAGGLLRRRVFQELRDERARALD